MSVRIEAKLCYEICPLAYKWKAALEKKSETQLLYTNNYYLKNKIINITEYNSTLTRVAESDTNP